MDIFKALSDPTRRIIVENLHQHGPQSIKQLSQCLPISRQALTKHLNRLVSAKIVSAEFVGKEKIHRLESKPMEKLIAWMAPFAQQWDNRLLNLVKHIGENHEQ